MRHLIRLFAALFIANLIVFLIGSCTPSSRDAVNLQHVTHALDSLQKIYAPDKRTTLWQYNIKQQGDTPELTLWVDKEKAFEAVNKLLQSKLSGVTAQVELLPEKNREMPVTALANNSVINLRTAPRHSAELATQIRLGTPLKVLKRQDEWYLVQCPDKYIAWTDDDAIVEMDNQQLKRYKEADKIVYNKMCGFSYGSPDRQSQVVSDLVMGAVLPVTGVQGAYYQVRYPDGRTAYVMKEEVLFFKDLVQSDCDVSQLIKRAKRFNGAPYMWGGSSSKAVDCSGFTSLLYFMSGIVLQRDASQQARYGKVVTTRYNDALLQPGDLLFFGRPAVETLPEKVTHVALYIGEGQFIHASGKVRINSMVDTAHHFIPTYPPRFVRAVRVKNSVDGTGIQRIKDNPFYKAILP